MPLLPDQAAAKTPPRARSSFERQLQASMIAFYSVAVYPGQAILFAVPNGEDRNPIVAAMLSGISAAERENLAAISDDEALRPFGQGVLPGVPDLFMLLPGGRTEKIEVKRPRIERPGEKALRAGALSRQQRRFRDKAVALGHSVHQVDSLEAWADLLEAFGLRLRCRPFGAGIKPRSPAAFQPPGVYPQNSASDDAEF